VRKTNSLRDIFLWAGLDPTVFARRFNAAYAAGWRENRKRIRAAKSEAKHRAYAVNGLNGPRACERRFKQQERIEAKNGVQNGIFDAALADYLREQAEARRETWRARGKPPHDLRHSQAGRLVCRTRFRNWQHRDCRSLWLVLVRRVRIDVCILVSEGKGKHEQGVCGRVCAHCLGHCWLYHGAFHRKILVNVDNQRRVCARDGAHCDVVRVERRGRRESGE
jgi:hypothetical protein